MRFGTLISLALALALLAPLAQAQSADEPRFVNRMLDDIRTPAITPGDDGILSFTVNNPDAINLTSPMENVSIAVSIYHYATLEDFIPISEISNPPVIAESGTIVLNMNCGDIPPGGSYAVNLTIQTEKGTPHGSYFSQSSYLVRFMLSFSYQGQNYTMASRGHFTDAEWEHLKLDGTVGEMNQTYLEELGFDGIIPDTAFSVRKNIPLWPFFALVGLTVLSGLTALSFYVLDNPGRYTKLEVRLLRLSGRMTMWKLAIRRRFGKKR
ncbi:MAG: hypothetical protein KKH41_01515 [Candidatus Thermoplasmatota archaeon]|nr:hypothetical protein [Euryarchaeota archaeon]MBU4031395.1 hypothetical protein [Candidatus Thermoplasmatota archaeon]MBU4072231.1 hypothetical protein [Candidatus Thermoplasmatota archaeon]MBU4145278.1 hypothetical protein [Candidatus Thermoplasmatota archaeon]MBU4591240.1 hypothetical protein [Candidatus Thermoplasmatota archaeon]